MAGGAPAFAVPGAPNRGHTISSVLDRPGRSDRNLGRRVGQLKG